MRQVDKEWLRTLGAVSSVSLLILIATGIGMLLGLWLDRLFGTAPLLAFFLTLVGLAAGLIEAVRILIKATK